MTKDDLPRLAAVLRHACILYRQTFSEDLVTAYATILKDDSIEKIERAAVEHARSSRFFPAPCDLLVDCSEPDVDVMALNDFAAIKQGLAPKSEIADEALRLVGGLVALQGITISDAAHRRREFVETYKAIAASKKRAGITQKQLEDPMVVAAQREAEIRRTVDEALSKPIPPPPAPPRSP